MPGCSSLATTETRSLSGLGVWSTGTKPGRPEACGAPSRLSMALRYLAACTNNELKTEGSKTATSPTAARGTPGTVHNVHTSRGRPLLQRSGKPRSGRGCAAGGHTGCRVRGTVSESVDGTVTSASNGGKVERWNGYCGARISRLDTSEAKR